MNTCVYMMFITFGTTQMAILGALSFRHCYNIYNICVLLQDNIAIENSELARPKQGRQVMEWSLKLAKIGSKRPYKSLWTHYIPTTIYIYNIHTAYLFCTFHKCIHTHAHPQYNTNVRWNKSNQFKSSLFESSLTDHSFNFLDASKSYLLEKETNSYSVVYT